MQHVIAQTKQIIFKKNWFFHCKGRLCLNHHTPINEMDCLFIYQLITSFLGQGIQILFTCSSVCMYFTPWRIDVYSLWPRQQGLKLNVSTWSMYVAHLRRIVSKSTQFNAYKISNFGNYEVQATLKEHSQKTGSPQVPSWRFRLPQFLSRQQIRCVRLFGDLLAPTIRNCMFTQKTSW